LQDLAMIKQIKFVSIPVTDQDRALEFYTKKLGFRVVTDAPFSGEQRWIELAIPRAETRVVLFTPEEHKKMIGGFMNISFTADNVETTVRELKERGVAFTQEPTTADWGTFAMFEDPDGNKFLVSTG
jgi:catechol 2,3-dioxygenase-like lactoylglutathione lyase family enzyme